MAAIDWLIIGIYVSGMLLLGVYLGRSQSNETDYYVGGRDLPWWSVALSVVATQSSAISFVSIPAFVALREGGGLKWLQFEMAVPLAMILVMVFLVPYFRSLKLVSVFEFIEKRFGNGTAKLLSFVFLFSRGIGTGVGVYATSLVLTAMLDIELKWTILLIGVVAIIYDTLGGIKAVVYSDVIQLVLMVVGGISCSILALNLAGGFENVFDVMDNARMSTADMKLGIGDHEGAPFWAFLIGGFFLYSSYYGTDQSQVQRVLCTKNTHDARKTIFINGLVRLPLTLVYLLLGVSLAVAYHNLPELKEAIPDGHLDYLVPKFIVMYVPTGFKGLILAAILSAAMSSVDSALNALSAVTMKDYVEKYVNLSEKGKLIGSKVTTVIWGVLVTLFAFVAGDIDKTVVEAINKVGSAFYGPVLVAFLVGILNHKVKGISMSLGVLAGVIFNLCLWIFDYPVHWMWWNAFGAFITFVATFALSTILKENLVPIKAHFPSLKEAMKDSESDRKYINILILYFIFILFLVVGGYVIFN